LGSRAFFGLQVCRRRYPEQDLGGQFDFLGFAVVIVALRVGCDFGRHERAAYLNCAIFFLLLLVSLILGHLRADHVPHQARVPVLAFRSRRHVAFLRVVQECFGRLLHVRSQTFVEAGLADGARRAVDERLLAHALVGVLDAAVTHVRCSRGFVLCPRRGVARRRLHRHLRARVFVDHDHLGKFRRVLQSLELCVQKLGP